MPENPPESLLSTLVVANHILHYHDVVDAFGHISVRNPNNASTFFLSGSLAPALVSGLDDLVEYHVEDASPVKEDSPKGYSERFIHSEIYKKYTDVNSVVHGHPEAVIPFSVSSQPIRPIFHMAGVIGAQVPVFDISLHYKQSDTHHSLLVTNQHLGAGLANAFNPSTTFSKTTNIIKNYLTSTPEVQTAFPPITTALMRGHGFSCIGSTIQEAVYRAIFLCSNAKIQTTALMLQNAHNVRGMGGKKGVEDVFPVQMEDVRYLSEKEVKDAWEMNRRNAERPWKLWCKEVETSRLYTNNLGPPPGV